MRKKNILVLLVFLFVVVLTSCSGLGGDVPSSGAPSSSEPSRSSSPTNSSTGTETSAQSSQDGSTSSNVSRNYTVTFDANGGVFDSGLNTYTVTASDGQSVEYKKPSRNNDTFLFYIDTEFNKWDFGSAVNDDTIFKAVWESDFLVLSDYVGLEKDSTYSFTLTVKKSVTSLDLSEVIKITDKCNLSLYFGEYEIDKILNLTNYYSLSECDFVVNVYNSQLGQQVSYTIHLRLVNDEEIIKISYYVDGVVVKTDTVQAGLSYEITYVPQDSSRTFNCWLDSSNNRVTTITPTSDINLYAKFFSSYCDVTLNPNGGIVDTESLRVNQNDSYTLPVPTKENYRFLGWSESNTYYTNDQGEAILSLEGKNKIILTAMWEEVTPTTDEIDDGNLVYVYDTDLQGYLVKGLGSNNPTDVVVPETFNDKPVVGIAQAAFQDKTINTLVLPDSIELVGDSCVSGATIDKVYYNGTLAQWWGIKFERTSRTCNAFKILNENGRVDYQNIK